MKVLLTLTTPGPRWAMRDKRDRITRPSGAQFGRFATAAGRHFGDRVDAWAAVNEPNHPQFLAPQYSKKGRPLSPGIYRSLFLGMASGLEASGNGDDTLLMGETAPRGNHNVVHPITFLRGALCLNRRYRRAKSCKPLPVDGWAHHPYTTREGPWFRPPDKRDVTIGVLSRLVRALDRATRARAFVRRTKLPVWLTEFGIQSTPDRYLGVSLAKQLEFRAIAERMAWGNPRVRAFSQYLLRDDRPIAGESGRSRYGGFESGLRFATGREKPSLAGFRLAMAGLRTGRRVALWGVARPASGPVDVEVQYADRGRGFRQPAKTCGPARGATSPSRPPTARAARTGCAGRTRSARRSASTNAPEPRCAPRRRAVRCGASRSLSPACAASPSPLSRRSPPIRPSTSRAPRSCRAP